MEQIPLIARVSSRRIRLREPPKLIIIPQYYIHLYGKNRFHCPIQSTRQVQKTHLSWTHGGCNLYFVYTPDVDVPIERQLIDGVTGLWSSRRTDDGWSDPEKVKTSDEDTLDGCPFIQGEELWFCSARPGYTGVNFFIADLDDSNATNVRYADERLNDDIVVGELHITTDGRDLYYHALRPGGTDMDIWVTHLMNGTWSDPENVNTIKRLSLRECPI